MSQTKNQLTITVLEGINELCEKFHDEIMEEIVNDTDAFKKIRIRGDALSFPVDGGGVFSSEKTVCANAFHLFSQDYESVAMAYDLFNAVEGKAYS